MNGKWSADIVLRNSMLKCNKLVNDALVHGKGRSVADALRKTHRSLVNGRPGLSAVVAVIRVLREAFGFGVSSVNAKNMSAV